MKNRPVSILVAVALLLATAGSAFAIKPVPRNLGNGLVRLVDSQLKLNNGAPAILNGHATLPAGRLATRSFIDQATGRYMVDVFLDGRVSHQDFLSSLTTKVPSFQVTATDTKYRKGVVEGYVLLNDVATLARTPGVSSVALVLKPITSVGAVTDYGVHFHRVNRVNSLYNPNVSTAFDGTGVQIGVLSDSYDAAAAAATHAPADVLTGDLPGAGNTANPQPVVVLQDYTDPAAATDEGRGMCQIIHDVAPKARIGFATAFGGTVGFANNIRALAGLPGYVKDPNVQQGFKGDVVCDDVSYLDEPMFSDGLIAQAVNDVVAAGVHYASSAANNWGVDGYASAFRPVANGTGLTPATNTALANTNINLTGVDPALYAGGFHNFNPSGKDVAQTVNTGSDAPFVFQWNDPYDVTPPAIIEPPIFEQNGTSTGGSEQTYTPPPFTKGQPYVIRVTATGTPPVDNFDAIVAVIDPNGKTIIDQDTGTDEVVTFFAPLTGQYTIRVHPFYTSDPLGVTEIPTQGPYNIKVNNATGQGQITADFNILFFDMSGNFISALGDDNFSNNRPIEFDSLSFADAQVQMVIARANTPAAGTPTADQLKYVFFGNGASNVGPAEYFNYLAPVTFGHSAAAGALSVAAYSNFRPNIPEDFTSMGPVTHYFDAAGNRLASPQIRLKPDIAAADGANNTFFPIAPVPGVTDSLSDIDQNFANFFGTSAASPHCAALCVLLVQKYGVGAVTPAQMKKLLQNTAFPHDLDPYSASGSARASNGGKVSIVVNSDSTTNTGTGGNDPNSWNVTYVGPGRLATLKFNPEGTAATGGNTTGGNFNGLTPDQFLDPAFYKYTPGMVFLSSTLFGNSTGLTAADVQFTRSNPAPFPSNPSPGNTTAHMWTLNLNFPNNNFTGGKVLRFNVGRGQQQDSASPQGMTAQSLSGVQYSADLLGSGVLIPEDPNGNDIKPGMTFNGTIVDGANTYNFNGRLTNRIGRGYSVLDGFGVINIEAALAAPLP